MTVIAALLGNVLGYTVFKGMCAAMYYGSYSLPTYETRWNADAFILTTVIPVALMLVINLLLISRKLQLSPLKFLRHDLSTSAGKKQCVCLILNFSAVFCLLHYPAEQIQLPDLVCGNLFC